MKYRIVHSTSYRYSEPASLSQNELFLTPRNSSGQQRIDIDIAIAPRPQYEQVRRDYFGNLAQLFMIQHPHSELVITATSTVSTTVQAAPKAESTPPWEQVVERLRDHPQPADLDAYQFRFGSGIASYSPEITAYARASFLPGEPILVCALDLISRIFHDFEYDKHATTVDTPVEQVLATGKGVCQDFSHLAISCLRSLGLAARYISGYLETQPPKGKERLVGADASHAWLSVYIPDFGWLDLDPTNNLIPGELHITLAWGRDYADVTPVKGVVMGGGVHNLSVMVDVSRRND